jgi:transposase
LRWHLHALDPTFVVPLRMLSRPSHLERVNRWLARQEQELQVRLARELAEIGRVDRFKSDARLARHCGVAQLGASSGRTRRHRLDRGGNRQLTAALYRIAITQARYHPAACAYLERKRAEGKSRREAIRCLKRLLVSVVFNTLKASPALT